MMQLALQFIANESSLDIKILCLILHLNEQQWFTKKQKKCRISFTGHPLQYHCSPRHVEGRWRWCSCASPSPSNPDSTPPNPWHPKPKASEWRKTQNTQRKLQMSTHPMFIQCASYMQGIHAGHPCLDGLVSTAHHLLSGWKHRLLARGEITTWHLPSATKISKINMD